MHRDFNDIYLRSQDRVYRLAVWIVGDRQEAEDVVQGLYERLWPRREEIAELSDPEGYILASARNYSVDTLRRRRPRAEFPPAIPYTGARPDEGEIEGIVARLIAELPENQGTVLRLRDVECMEMERIAEVMGMRPTAVRMALSRARNTVKEKLEKIMNYGI